MPTSGRIYKPERFPNVDAEDDNENKCEIKKISVHILHNERERALTEIRFSRLTDGAGRWVRPKRLVIGATIIITGQAEYARRPKN